MIPNSNICKDNNFFLKIVSWWHQTKLNVLDALLPKFVPVPPLGSQSVFMMRKIFNLSNYQNCLLHR